jgi:hypothetical protein
MYDLLEDIELFLGEHGLLAALSAAALVIIAVYHLTH